MKTKFKPPPSIFDFLVGTKLKILTVMAPLFRVRIKPTMENLPLHNSINHYVQKKQ